ncbi:MAG: hypothetical protein AB1405_07775 [Bdellovibrionota bacterium]
MSAFKGALGSTKIGRPIVGAMEGFSGAREAAEERERLLEEGIDPEELPPERDPALSGLSGFLGETRIGRPISGAIEGYYGAQEMSARAEMARRKRREALLNAPRPGLPRGVLGPFDPGPTGGYFGTRSPQEPRYSYLSPFKRR